MEPLISKIPFLTCPGNHDIETVANFPEYSAYINRFVPPWIQSLSDSPLYYSFEVATAHIIFLNSYSDISVSSPQYDFLLSDLEKVDRNKTPWLMVVFHTPWYHSNSDHQRSKIVSKMKFYLESIFLQYGVDIVVSGHVHAYERTVSIYNGTISSFAPTYITVGTGGNREGKASEWLHQPIWSAFREAEFGHGRFSIFNKSHAKWSWIRNGKYTSSDEVFFQKNVEIYRGSKSYIVFVLSFVILC